MHLRRMAAMLLGGWLAGSLLMAVVAIQNFRAVDRLLASPFAPTAQKLQTLGKTDAQGLLRYHASQQNRWYFETWEQVQFGLGGLLLLALLWGSHWSRNWLLVPIFMLAAVAILHWFLTPEMAELGRAVAFSPTDPPSPGRTRLSNLHLAYGITDGLKLALGVILAGRLVIRRGRYAAREIAHA